jgi:selenocysteine-specific elongation factor
VALLVDRDARRYLSAEVFEGMLARAQAMLGAFHDAEPMKEGLSKEELRGRLSSAIDPKLWARVVTSLVEKGKAEQDKELLRLPGRGRTLTLSEEGSRAKLLAELSAARLGPPRVDELAGKLALPVPRTIELLKVAVGDGAVVKVTDELYFDRSSLEELKGRLVEHLKTNKEISTQSFKEMVGQSRKFVIPLSEYFDREKVTLRVGEKRVLRKG